MNNVSPLALEQSVVTFCKQLLQRDPEINVTAMTTETALWKGATTAVLSSQVGYEVACAYSGILENRGLLPSACQSGIAENYETEILKTLSQPVTIKSNPRRYRFPKLRARQLATTAKRFNESQNTLSNFFKTERCPKDLRGRLIEYVDGMGTKQASMFIRDSGRSDELAIIDSHVLDYMGFIGLIEPLKSKQITSAKYLKLEKELQNYAKFLQLPLGKLDWSIWVMMRVVKKGELN